MTDKIAEALEVTPLIKMENNPVAKKTINNEIDIYKDNTDNDFDEVRQNIRQVAELGAAALLQLSNIADSSQSPRDYEVLTELMKSVVSANRQLLEIKKTQIDINEKKGHAQDAVPQTVNNILFTGSTKDALEQLRNLSKDKK